MKTLLLLLLALAGCSTRPAPDGRGDATIGRSAGDAAAPQALESTTPASVLAGPVRGSPRADPERAESPGMLIRTGDASLEVDSLEPAVAAIRALAGRVGGWIANSTLSAGREQMREATLQIRIPAARFDEAQGGLQAIGLVEWVNVATEDVGEEYVDIAARVANARRLEQRLVELLARGTGKLDDVLAVERELARVREEIDRLEGRLRFLRSRAATSTLAVRLHEPVPIIAGTGSTGVIAEAFRQAWRNFVSAVAACIAASGVLGPLAVVGMGAWVGARKLRRGVRREA